MDFRDLVVSYLLNMSRPILFALPLLGRRRFKMLLAMTARADEHTRQRIRTGETNMRALRTKDRDESHSNACGASGNMQITTEQTRCQCKFGDWSIFAKLMCI